MRELDEINLTLDEAESIRLADLQNFYHEDAAKQMGISRATFGRILQSAHKKVADALINGKAVRVEGGNVTLDNVKHFVCLGCKYLWKTTLKKKLPTECPSCGKQNLIRVSNHPLSSTDAP